MTTKPPEIPRRKKDKAAFTLRLPAGGPFCRLTRDMAANLFPGYFSVVMATGATAISSHLLGFTFLARVLFGAALLALAVLWLLTLIRLLRFPRRLAQDMASHSRGPGFFTLVAGNAITGSACWIILHCALLATVFWVLALVLWLTVMYSFFLAVTIRDRKPTLTAGINGAWLLAAVATHSVSILTVLMPWSRLHPELLLLALCFFLLGCMLYLAIITLIFYRLTFLQVTVESLTPPYWINMGAVAITTLAGSTLILASSQSDLIQSVLPFLRGFTLLFWTTATWWIPLLVGLTIWRHGIRRFPLRYEPQLWSIVFPLAMYTTGTWRLAEALNQPILFWIPRMTFWLTLLTWTLTSAGFWRHLHQQIRGKADIAE